jgi:hypothetical protein
MGCWWPRVQISPAPYGLYIIQCVYNLGDYITSKTVRKTDNQKEEPSTFKERIKKKLGQWNDIEEETGKDKLKEFLDSNQSKRYLTNTTRAALLSVLDKYDKSMTKRAVGNAIYFTILDVWSHSKKEEKLNEDEIGKKVEKAASILAKVLNYKPIINSVNKTANKLGKYTDNNTVMENIFNTVYEPEFYKTNNYSIDNFTNKTLTIISVYENYNSYKEFFNRLGIKITKPKIFIRPAETHRSRFVTSTQDIQLQAYPEATISLDRAVVHEITHMVQSRGKKDMGYGKNYGEDQNVVSNMVEYKKEPQTEIIVEAGSEFMETLYFLNSTEWGLDPTKDVRYRILGNLKFWANIRAENKTSKYTFNEWNKKIYDTLKNSDDYHKAFYDLVKDDYSKWDNNNKYLIGASLATIVFSCNKFNTKETVNDLVNIDEPYKLIDKIAGIIKSDKNGHIFESLTRALEVLD